jgi:K+-sensing histidine kinase KdpD
MMAPDCHGRVRILHGQDVARTLLELVRCNHVTQIFLSRALLSSRRPFFKWSLMHEITRAGTLVSAQRAGAEGEGQTQL